MFSIKGRIIKGDDEKKSLILLLNKPGYDKVEEECSNLCSTMEATDQILFPCWSKVDGLDQSKSYYCKMLLSKARKDQYEVLKQLRDIEHVFTVRASNYSIKNASSGQLDGISLYFQGMFTSGAKRVRSVSATRKQTQDAKQELTNAQEPM